MLASAAAQVGGSTPVVNQPRDLYSFEHHIHVAPKTPADYRPITAEGRLDWFARETVGPKSLTAGLFSSAIGTALNSPHEYGPHWEGFAQRYGMRMTGISTGNAIEAALGAAWGEDPRYFRTVHHPFGDRVKNVVDLTFRAYHPDGRAPLGLRTIRGRIRQQLSLQYLARPQRLRLAARPDSHCRGLWRARAFQRLQRVRASGVEEGAP